MAYLNLPLQGHCRCEQVRFTVSEAPIITMACHCTGCQRMTSSAFSLSALIPSKAFTITSGQTVIGGLRGATRHYFCPHCMSWMYTQPEGRDDLVNLRVTMLDDTSWFVPFVETFTSEKLPWVELPATRSFERFPAAEDFAGLIAEYRSKS